MEHFNFKKRLRVIAPVPTTLFKFMGMRFAQPLEVSQGAARRNFYFNAPLMRR
jgi:hypothetical protein